MYEYFAFNITLPSTESPYIAPDFQTGLTNDSDNLNTGFNFFSSLGSVILKITNHCVVVIDLLSDKFNF